MAAGFISKETQGTLFQGCTQWKMFHLSISKFYQSFVDSLFKENCVFNICLCNTILHLVAEMHKASLMEKTAMAERMFTALCVDLVDLSINR